MAHEYTECRCASLEIDARSIHIKVNQRFDGGGTDLAPPDLAGFALSQNAGSDQCSAAVVVRWPAYAIKSQTLTAAVVRQGGIRRAECYNFLAIQRLLPGSAIIVLCPRSCRGVAQPGRAPGSGPGGRRFKSSLPDQQFSCLFSGTCGHTHGTEFRSRDFAPLHLLQEPARAVSKVEVAVI